MGGLTKAASFSSLPCDSVAQSFLADMAHFNSSLSERANGCMQRSFSKLNIGVPFCVATTGSDGRSEKGGAPSSPMELIVLIGTNASTQREDFPPSFLPESFLTEAFREEVLLKVRDALNKNSEVDRKLFDPRITIQFPTDNPLVSSATGKARVIPNRLLEISKVYGNEEIMQEQKKHTFQSLKEMTPKEKRGYKEDFYKCSKKDLEKCCSGELLNDPVKHCVDLQQGILLYDGTASVKSTKYPFLRPVQYKLMNFLIGAAQSGKLTEELYKEMPSQIYHRIIWMQEKGLLPISAETAQSLSFSYLQALQWHLLSQMEFAQKVTEVQVDPGELKEVADVIRTFINLDDPLFQSK